MASSTRPCDICSEQHQTSTAVAWCAECEESLCDQCRKHHDVAKLTKKHDTIPIQTFEQLPDFAKEMKNECSEHDLRFEYFCSGHDILCCVQCLRTSHIECRSISPIHEVIRRDRSMTALEEIENMFKDVSADADLLINDRENNLESLAEQKDKCMDKIEEVKNNILLTLDKLVEKLQNELEDIYEEKKSAIVDVINDLAVQKDSIQTMILQSQTVRDFGSELQMFLSLSAFQNRLSEKEKYLVSVTQLDASKNAVIDLTYKDIENLENSMSGYYDLSIKESSCRIRLPGRRAKQAQLWSISDKDIDVSKISCTPVIEHMSIDTSYKKHTIYSNCFLDDGRFACCDYEKQQILIYKDKLFDYLIQLSIKPSCIAQLDDVQVVVTDCSNKLHILNINSRKTSILFEMDDKLDSVSVHSKGFCFRAGSEWFCVTDFSGIMLHKVKFEGENILAAVFAEEKIFFSQWSTEKVTCCDCTGHIIWEFKNSLLNTPVGISVHRNILFVTGFKSNNVVALQNNGIDYKELYSNSLMGKTVRSVSYDKNKLLVMTKRGKIYLLKLTF